MRVLISAYACEPNKGSEPGIGWNWACQAARCADVSVITRTSNRSAIEEWLRESPVAGLHFIYHDLPRWARWWKRGGRGFQLYYALWQLTAFFPARRAHRVLSFDIGHHITIGTFRNPTFLTWLGIPYLWGPVAGGERATWSFLPSLGARGAIGEVVRDAANVIARLNPLVLITMRRAAMILVTTDDTLRALPRSVAAKALVVPAMGHEGGNPGLTLSPQEDRLRLLFVGRLVPWKGVQYAIEAVAGIADRVPDISLTVVGDGSFKAELERLSERLGISNQVHFTGPLSFAETQTQFDRHDAFLFPSLHDSGGFAVLEAMAAGLPVVCLDAGGPGLAVAPDTGIKVPPHSPQQVIKDIQAALIRLSQHPELRIQMGSAGQNRVAAEFSWCSRGDQIARLYASCQTAGRTEPTPR